MFDFFKKFDQLPQSVKAGVILLMVSWGWFFISMYFFFFNRSIPPELQRALLVGPMVCLAVFRLANWARILCLTSNAMVIIYFIYFIMIFIQSNLVIVIICLINITLFGITSYYLAIKTSSSFFKTYNKPAETDEAGDDNKT